MDAPLLCKDWEKCTKYRTIPYLCWRMCRYKYHNTPVKGTFLYGTTSHSLKRSRKIKDRKNDWLPLLINQLSIWNHNWKARGQVKIKWSQSVTWGSKIQTWRSFIIPSILASSYGQVLGYIKMSVLMPTFGIFKWHFSVLEIERVMAKNVKNEEGFIFSSAPGQNSYWWSGRLFRLFWLELILVSLLVLLVFGL